MNLNLPKNVLVIKDLVRNIVKEKVVKLEPNYLNTDGCNKAGDLDPKIIGELKRLSMTAGIYKAHLPKQFEGGGMGALGAAVIDEETSKSIVRLPVCHVPNILIENSTDLQIQKYVKPYLNGNINACFAQTEPNAGSDLASLQSRAVRDGDDWIISGQKVFIGNPPDGDWLYGPIITDPEAPRHRNLGFFLIPVKTSGIEFRAQHLLGGASHQHFLFMDNVRVPGDHLIGGDHQGWQVTNTSLEQEHGGRGQAFPRDEAMDNLLTYVRDTQREGSSLGKNPVVQQSTMDSYIASHTNTLFAKRNFWMYG